MKAWSAPAFGHQGAKKVGAGQSKCPASRGAAFSRRKDLPQNKEKLAASSDCGVSHANAERYIS
jgi:hypothetical protein